MRCGMTDVFDAVGLARLLDGLVASGIFIDLSAES